MNKTQVEKKDDTIEITITLGSDKRETYILNTPEAKNLKAQLEAALKKEE